MSAYPVEFRRGVIEPVACLKAGWSLIKEQYWLFLGITVVALFIGSAIPFGILMGPMYCGIYLCLLRRQRGEPITFELLFKGFEYFKESVIAILIQVVPVILILIPFYIVFFAIYFSALNRPRGSSSPPPEFGIYLGIMIFLIIVAVVIGIIIGALFIFTFPLIVDRKLSGVEAIKTSARAAYANIGGVISLILLFVVCAIAGLLACYVGVFFFVPIQFAATATAYRQVFPEEIK